MGASYSSSSCSSSSCSSSSSAAAYSPTLPRPYSCVPPETGAAQLHAQLHACSALLSADYTWLPDGQLVPALLVPAGAGGVPAGERDWTRIFGRAPMCAVPAHFLDLLSGAGLVRGAAQSYEHQFALLEQRHRHQRNSDRALHDLGLLRALVRGGCVSLPPAAAVAQVKAAWWAGLIAALAAVLCAEDVWVMGYLSVCLLRVGPETADQRIEAMRAIVRARNIPLMRWMASTLSAPHWAECTRAAAPPARADGVRAAAVVAGETGAPEWWSGGSMHRPSEVERLVHETRAALVDEDWVDGWIVFERACPVGSSGGVSVAIFYTLHCGAAKSFRMLHQLLVAFPGRIRKRHGRDLLRHTQQQQQQDPQDGDGDDDDDDDDDDGNDAALYLSSHGCAMVLAAATECIEHLMFRDDDINKLNNLLCDLPAPISDALRGAYLTSCEDGGGGAY